MHIRTLAFLSALFLGLPSTAFAALDSAENQEKELRILRITPEGLDVPAGRQIVLEFNRPVVPLGRMERASEEIPITITPPLKCEWRWLDTSSLSCNLGEKDMLAQATKYDLTINPGIRAEDGVTLAEAQHHSFITERPDVRYSWFKTWKSPGTPVIRVVFNQPVTKQSVDQHLYLTRSEKTDQRFSLVATPDPDDEEPPVYLPLPGEKMAMINTDAKPRKSDDQVGSKNGIETRRVWLVSPANELPLDSAISMRIEPGLVSASGLEMGVGERETVQFFTFPEFKFIGVKCVTNRDKPVIIAPGQTQSDTEKCNPLGYISLAFSSPVMRSEAKEAVLFKPDLSGGRKDYDPWGEVTDYSSLGQAYRKDNTYDIYLPSVFKADAAYTVSLKEEEKGFFARLWDKIVAFFSSEEKPKLSVLKDEFGRVLSLPPAIQFATDHRKPNFEILHHEAILEKEIDSELPLYVTNLNTATLDFRSITADGLKENQSHTVTPAKVRDLQFAIPFGVRKALGGASGALFGYLDTEPDIIGKEDYERRLFAEVTPYQVHVKLGHFSTLVWVTDFATGQPVADAKLSVYQDTLTTMGLPKPVLASSVTDTEGLASLPGTNVLDPDLVLSRSWKDDEPKLFVRVDKGKDIAIIPLNNDFSIDTWRASNETMFDNVELKYGHLRTWGTTAQGIYRAGDTIQYKFYVRNQDDRTLIPAPKEGYTLTITDPTGKAVETLSTVKLDAFGGYSGEYKIPEHGAVGWYNFVLKPAYTDLSPKDDSDTARTWTPMRVLVSDFTPSAFKVTTDLNGDLFGPEQNVAVATAAVLHSGGAYTDASARITAILDSQPFYSKHPLAQAFSFDSYADETKSQQLFQAITPLNDKGELNTTFSTGTPNIVYGTLTVKAPQG
ncbi:MAG: MG2 domain-containing protein [Rickettsiales bacterium]